ncbi:MAG: DNA-binding protein [Nitrososphaeria archaeon]|nr:DNA-binding protein [Nitrososphaeria archaeon]NIQ33439.1 DNA-binding protein [Nitrososphaeria archaeon]
MRGYGYPQGEKPDEEEEKRLRESILRVYLTPTARQRLTNVSLVKPEIAKSIENLIISLVSSGRLNKKIDEEELKNILLKMQQSRKREFRFRRI